MSDKKDKVKQRIHEMGLISKRKRGAIRKRELMSIFNHECQHCGYDKNAAALCFHHIDESTKSFGITAKECASRTMEVLMEEVSKCILLCANCHMALHYPEHDF